MKISIHSDLHNESRNHEILPVVPDAEVLVFAGDVTSGMQTPDYYRKVASANPKANVIFVLGNHEHYGGQVEDIIHLNRESFKNDTRIHFLENSHVEISGVEFIGATLWSDFGLAKNPEQISFIEERIADFYKIRYGSRKGLIRANGGMKAMFSESYRYIKSRLIESRSSKKIVITHFSPHEALGHIQFLGSKLTPYFISDCRELFHLRPDLWVYGHTHCNSHSGQLIEGVWVESNCGGYVSESTGYQRAHIIEI